MFDNLFAKFARDIGVDLGTSTTLLYVRDKGIVVDESSIVAVNNRTGQILAVGEEAEKMVGKTPPHIVVSRPLVGGVISDFEVAEKMLKHFFDRIRRDPGTFSPRPRVIVGVPLDVTEVEKKAVEDVVLSAGAREVFLVDNVIATAIGARMPIQDASGNLVVAVGGGVTEVAVISLSGVVAWRSIKVAGNEFDQGIIQFVKNEFGLLIGDQLAEWAKIKAGVVRAMRASAPATKGAEPKAEIKLRGRDISTGLPREIFVSVAQLRQAVHRSVTSIVDSIKSTLEVTPPELVADIYQRGMVLAGAGSQLTGLVDAISAATKIPVKLIDDPSTCVVRGMGLILEDETLLREVAVPSSQAEEKVR